MTPQETEQTRADIVQAIPALRRFARSFCRSETDAEDLVQETLVKALGSLDSYRPGPRVTSWLFTILRNAFYTKYNQIKRESPGLIEDCAGTVVRVDPPQEWHIRALEFDKVLQSLSVTNRVVYDLILVRGLRYEDAAVQMNCAVGTIKSRVNRLRKHFQAKLG